MEKAPGLCQQAPKTACGVSCPCVPSKRHQRQEFFFWSRKIHSPGTGNLRLHAGAPPAEPGKNVHQQVVIGLEAGIPGFKGSQQAVPKIPLLAQKNAFFLAREASGFTQGLRPHGQNQKTCIRWLLLLAAASCLPAR